MRRKPAYAREYLGRRAEGFAPINLVVVTDSFEVAQRFRDKAGMWAVVCPEGHAEYDLGVISGLRVFVHAENSRFLDLIQAVLTVDPPPIEVYCQYGRVCP
jgi:hypothetical protein